jgi:uncharacterized protein
VRALLDVNVLIALHDEDHVHHQRVQTWFSARPQSEGWASCPLTQNGALRILAQPSYPRPFPMQDLVARLRRSFGAAEHRFWPDDVSLLDPASVDASRMHGPRQITDIYLLALAVRHAGRLVTLDAAIPLAAVPMALPEHLVRLVD